MKNNIGKMRHRVDILQKSLVRNDIGGMTETWTVEAILWANVKAKSANYSLQNDDKVNYIKYEFIFRDNSYLDEKKKLRFDSRFFDIKDFYKLDERGRFILAICEQSKNATISVS
jgi:SPP1 family predicted phage head-tail adaptor